MEKKFLKLNDLDAYKITMVPYSKSCLNANMLKC
jgi:hypothetical protein